jgi:mannose/fructose/N-acetylgalactosamine-specific phosphotransferase system component IID
MQLKTFSLIGGTLKHGVPQGSILGPLLFIIYINDLLQKINSILKPILFADDTSVIICNRNLGDFCTVANVVLTRVIEWFTANKLVLNLDKTNMKFITNNSPHCALRIDYRVKYKEETINIKFLGLQIDNHLTWKNHIDKMVPKLSGACYAVGSMYHISNINTLKSVYFTHFYSITKYGIIFWGNSSNSKKIFTLQKKIITIMVGAQPRTPCRSLFKKSEILPIPCQYIFH